MAATVTMNLYRGYYDEDNVKFKPTKEQKELSKNIYDQLMTLEDDQKLKFSSKAYKDLDKIFKIINNLYFPYYDLTISATSGTYTTYVVRGKNVKRAIRENKKIKTLLEDTVKKIGIIKDRTTQKNAVYMINDYFVNNFEYVMYGGDDDANRDTYANLLFNKKVGICQDYAYAFYLIATYCGIKTAIGYSHRGEGHAFNAVRISSRTTFLDTCWNNKKESPYLFMSKKAFEATDPYHKVDYITW